MKETTLAVIFVIHATAFLYFYFRRGRQVFHLLYCGGFVLLAGYYAYHSWQFFTGGEPEFPYVQYFRWAGIALCALATPFFLAHLFRIRRSKGREQELL